MIAHQAAVPAPPVVTAPGPREASFGLVSGRVGRRAVRVVVRVDGQIRGSRAPRRHRFSFHLRLPPRDVSLRVTAVAADGHAASTVVRPVLGLPASAAPRFAWGRRDPVLSRAVKRLARAFPGTAAVYVEDLRSGFGAAWNARARFPAASTLKLAVAVAALRALGRPPAAGTYLGSLLDSMLVSSDNRAANDLLAYLGGSPSGGGAIVTGLMHSLGLTDSEMYGGYLIEGKRPPPIPLTVWSQPAFGIGKYTTAWDLARLLRDVDLAAAAKGPLARTYRSFTPAAARFLLYELDRVHEPGRLGRYLPRGVRLAHKAGWISTARHDNGLVFWRRGSFVATVLTWNPSGAGESSDALAGRVAQVALTRFRHLSTGRA